MYYKKKIKTISTVFGNIDINSSILEFVKRTDTHVVLEGFDCFGIKNICNIPISIFEQEYERITQ